MQSTSPLISAGDSTIGSEYSQGITPGATWPNPVLSTRATYGNWEVGAYVYVEPGTQPPTHLEAPRNVRVNLIWLASEVINISYPKNIKVKMELHMIKLIIFALKL